MKKFIFALISMLYIVGAQAQIVTITPDTSHFLYRGFQTVQPVMYVTGLNPSHNYTSNWVWSFDSITWESHSVQMGGGQFSFSNAFSFCGDSVSPIHIFYYVKDNQQGIWTTDTIRSNFNLLTSHGFGLRMKNDVPTTICEDSSIYMRNVYYGPSGTINQISMAIAGDWIVGDTMLLMLNGNVISNGYDTIDNGQITINWHISNHIDIHHMDDIELWLGGNIGYGYMYMYLVSFEVINQSTGNIIFPEYCSNQNWVLQKNHWNCTPTQTVEIETPEAKQMFTLYPNPTNGWVTIETEELNQNYRVTDVTGRLITSGLVTNNVTRIDVTTLPAGMYIISVGQETKKLIKI